MRIVDCVQGSPEWLQARLGIPTASNFHRIITPKTRKPSSQAETYMHELIAERLIGQPCDGESSQFMHRGTALEADAVAYYEFQREVTTAVGFCLADDGRAGCSPDRLVGESGGLEIKCFSAANHVGALLGNVDDKYHAQVQGCLWITGRAWWDRVWYNPVLPSVIQRVYPDHEFIDALDKAVAQFLDRLELEIKKI